MGSHFGNQLYIPTPMAGSAWVEDPIRHLHILVELWLSTGTLCDRITNNHIFQAERLFQENNTDRVELYYHSNDFVYQLDY